MLNFKENVFKKESVVAIKISIITITFNNYDELVKTVASVPEYSFIEHIIINGGSCNETKDFLNNSFKGKHLSEKDNGIYDAFNKGVSLSTGEWIMFLNSGDIMIDASFFEYLQSNSSHFASKNLISAGILYNSINKGQLKISPIPKKILKPWKGMAFPHPGLIVRSSLFKSFGSFNTSFAIAGDLDWVTRVLKKINIESVQIIDKYIVEMDGTGISSQNRFGALVENYRVMRVNNLVSVRGCLYIAYQGLKNGIHFVLRFLRFNV